MRDVVALYQHGDTDLRFELDLCPGPDGLSADSGRLRQMLPTLIRNAREAATTAPATVAIDSRIIEEHGARWLRLRIGDDGPGFPDAVLRAPFEPYVTHKPDGSGLGLAICRKIVSEHDGRIEIANPASGGARVEVWLPLQPM